MTDKQKQKLAFKKSTLLAQIIELRMERQELNTEINNHYKRIQTIPNPEEIVYKIYTINTELNIKRDAIDEINRKLYLDHQKLVYGTGNNQYTDNELKFINAILSK